MLAANGASILGSRFHATLIYSKLPSYIAYMMVAEGDKRAAILDAEGRKEAAFRDAEARERLAEAEGRATTMVSEAIASGDIQAINYFVAQKYVEALGKFATGPNQKTLLLPMEATSILGSLAGIAEVVKSALDKNE